MSHVDEGQIHAYLDHQLNFADRSAREQLEAHVASCTACAARLDDERSIHRTASSVLDRTAIGRIESPPFSSIIERAESTSTRRGTFSSLSKIRSLAVAASVMLAVAVGWYAQRSLGLLESASAPLRDSVPAPAILPLVDSLAVVPSTEAVAAEQENSPELDRRMSGLGAAAPTNQRPVATPPVEAPMVAALDAAEEEDAITVVSGAASAGGERRSEKRQQAQGVDTPVASRARVSPVVMDSVTRELIRTDARAPSVLAEATAGTTWSEIDRRAADQLLNQPMLTVDGLEIVLISTPRGGTDGLVRVVQLLPSGDSLELWQWPQGRAQPPKLGISIGSRRTARREVGRLVVWLMGPIAQDSIETLIAGLSR